jgi:pimeloyl-ACP methyl ester carboxylesterase
VAGGPSGGATREPVPEAGINPAVTRRRVVPGRAADLERAIETHGPSGAPVMVLLHGTRRTRAVWRRQVDGLSDAFRIITVDLPGHGALADVPFRLRDAADLVGAVIDVAGSGRAIVVGQSLGGYVGMDLAARRPDQVAGLVLADATGEPRSIARRAPRTVGAYLLVAAGERVRRPAARAGRSPTGPASPGRSSIGSASDGSADRRETRGSDRDGGDGPATNGWLFKGGTRALVSALQEVFKPRLAAYPGPTLIVNGEDDALFRHAEQEFLAAAVDGRLVVIPGGGHEVNEDQPEAFNAAVRAFAERVHGAAAAAAAGGA